MLQRMKKKYEATRRKTIYQVETKRKNNPNKSGEQKQKKKRH